MKEQKQEKKSFFQRNLVLILAVFYVIWPLDIIPDFLVALAGPAIVADDLLVVLIAVTKKILDYYKEKSPIIEKDEEDISKEPEIS